MRRRVFAVFLFVVACVTAASHWLSSWELSAIALVLAAAGSWLAVWPLKRRLQRLRVYSEALARVRASGIPDPTPDTNEDEIGDLSRSLRGIAPELRNLADRLGMELARREAILGSMIEGVLVVDPELRVSFCNDAFARAIGASGPASPGVPVTMMVRDPGFLDLLHSVLDTPSAEMAQSQFSGARGRSFEMLATPLWSSTAPGTLQGAVVILHDVTQLERLERVRRDFVANVSHELRTPLAVIRGYAETLLDGALEDVAKRQRFVQIILTNAMRLNNIASDLLALSDLESNKPLPEPSPLSVADSIDAAALMVEAEAREREVTLIRDEVPRDLRALGYKDRLEQALINLLTNAVKFNRPGGTVRVEARVAAGAEGGTVRIAISDTGVGIPSEDLPRVFERFYRVDKGRSRAVGGTGLGLSIVKHALEQMHGQVTVESTLGQGSCFTIELPATS